SSSINSAKISARVPSSNHSCNIRFSSSGSSSINLSHSSKRFSSSSSKKPIFRSEEHTSELQSRFDLVCRLLLEKKKKKKYYLLIYTLLVFIYRTQLLY